MTGEGRGEFMKIFGIDEPESRAFPDDDQLWTQRQYPVELVDGGRAENPHDRAVGDQVVAAEREPCRRSRIRKDIQIMSVRSKM